MLSSGGRLVAQLIETGSLLQTETLMESGAQLTATGSEEGQERQEGVASSEASSEVSSDAPNSSSDASSESSVASVADASSGAIVEATATGATNTGGNEQPFDDAQGDTAESSASSDSVASLESSSEASSVSSDPQPEMDSSSSSSDPQPRRAAAQVVEQGSRSLALLLPSPNLSADDLTITLSGTGGALEIAREAVDTDSGTLLTISPLGNITPGFYDLTVTMKSGGFFGSLFGGDNTLYEGKVALGFLALNADKAQYAATETATITAALMDTSGTPVCESLTLQTSDGSVPDKTSDTWTCIHGEGETFSFTVPERGPLVVSATTSREFRKDLPLPLGEDTIMVKREAATFVEEGKPFTVTLTLFSREEILGTIHESIGEGFDVTEIPEGARLASEGQNSALIWERLLPAFSPVTLTYTLEAKAEGARLSGIGPLSIKGTLQGQERQERQEGQEGSSSSESSAASSADSSSGAIIATGTGASAGTGVTLEPASSSVSSDSSVSLDASDSSDSSEIAPETSSESGSFLGSLLRSLTHLGADLLGSEPPSKQVSYDEGRTHDLLVRPKAMEQKGQSVTSLTLEAKDNAAVFGGEARFTLLDIPAVTGTEGQAMGDEEALKNIADAVTDPASITQAIIANAVKDESAAIGGTLSQDSASVSLLQDKVDGGSSRRASQAVSDYVSEKASDEAADRIAAVLQDDIAATLPDDVMAKVRDSALTAASQGENVAVAISKTMNAEGSEVRDLLKEAVKDTVKDKASEVAQAIAGGVTVSVVEPRPAVPPLDDARGDTASLFQVTLKDKSGKTFSPNFHFEHGSVVLVVEPEREFTPGLYTLEVTVVNPLTNESQTLTQDFAWGVLAMNTDQDSYRLNETGSLSIGVLDDEGKIVCDAKLSLSVTAPSGAVTEYETNPGFFSGKEKIAVTGTCGTKDPTLTSPDYEALLTFAESGNYALKLTAETKNGVRSMTQRVTVSGVEPRHEAPFDYAQGDTAPVIISRNAATRLYPVGTSPMDINVAFNEDFTGTITETLPGTFKVLDASGNGMVKRVTVSGVEPRHAASSFDASSALSTSSAQDDTVKTIAWKGTWNAGDTATFTYTYDAPDVSPDFFTVGPLTFKNVTVSVVEPRHAETENVTSFDSAQDDTFSEARSWQIANDDVTWRASTGPGLYTYMKKITVANTGLDENLTDFPLLVKVSNDTDMSTTNVQADGDDIRFSTATGMTLPFETEEFVNDSGSGSGFFWVKIPKIVSGADGGGHGSGALIYILYGSGAAVNGQNNTTVWDTDFKGVWHMHDASSPATDSTINENDGTQNGGVTFGASGKIDGATSFTGDDFFSTNDIDLTTGTLSTWVKRSSVTGTRQFLLGETSTSGSDAAQSVWFEIFSDNKLYVMLGNGILTDDSNYSTNTIADTNWHHASVTFDGSHITYYIDGIACGQYTQTVTPSDLDTNFRIAASRYTGYEGYLLGSLDEARVSDIARSAEWIAYEYANMNAPATYATFSSSLTKVWDGGGADNNWSTAGNWNDNAVPGASDIVMFDGTSSKNCTIDGNISVAGVKIDATYTGTITQSAAKTVTVGTSGWTQAGGTFTGSSGNTANDAVSIGSTFAGSFTLSGGTYTATAGTMTVSYGWSFTGGSFAANAGTVNFGGGSYGSDSVPINLGSAVFNNVVLNWVGAIAGSRNPGSISLVVNGNLTSTNAYQMNGSVVVGGDLTWSSGSDGGGSATITLNGTNTQHITYTGGLFPSGAVLIDKSSGTVTLSSDISFNQSGQDLTLSGGILDLNGYALTVNDQFSIGSSGALYIHGGSHTEGTFTNNGTLIRGIAWTGAAGDNKWTTADNWLGGAAPTADQSAEFGGWAAANATIDQDISVAGVMINGSYAGTITQAATKTITVTNWTQSGGTFTGGNGAIAVTGVLTLSAGSFTSTSGTMTLGNAYTSGTVTVMSVASGVTFSANGGTVKFITCHIGNSGISSVAVIDVDSSLTLNNVTIESAISTTFGPPYTGPNNGFTPASGDSIVVTGTLNLSDGYLAGAWELQGLLVVSSIFSSGTATVTFAGTGDQTYTAANTGTAPPIVIDKSAGTVTPATGTTSLRAATFTLTQGSFTAPSGTFKVGRDVSGSETQFTVSSGTQFNSNAGTVQFATELSGNCNVPSACVLDVDPSMRFHDVLIYPSVCGGGNTVFTTDTGDTARLSGDLIVENGSLQGSWEVAGTIRISSVADGGTASLTLSGSTTQVLESEGGTWPSGTFTINKSSGAAALSGALILNTSSQDLTLSGGTLNLAGYDLTVNDQFTIGANGTLVLHGDETVSAIDSNLGSIEYNGTGTYDAGLLLGDSYTNLTFSGNGSYTLDAPLDVNGNLRVSAGTFDVSSGNHAITVGGSWEKDGGTFTPRSGTVTFDATTTGKTLSGTTTFNTLVFNGSGGGWTVNTGTTTANTVTLTDGALTNSTTLQTTGNGTSLSIASGKTFTNNGTLTLAGTAVSNAGTWTNATASTVTFTGQADDSAVTLPSATFGNFVVENPGTTFTLGGAETVNGNLTISGGTLDVSGTNYDITVAGSWTENAQGDFTARSGTVTMAGGGTITAASAFNNLTMSGSSPAAYWKFDETSAGATVADASGNGYAGTPAGAGGSNNLPQPSTSVAPLHFTNLRSIDLDGTDDVVYFTAMTGLPQLTISFWANFDTFTEWDGVISNDRGTLLSSTNWDPQHLIFFVNGGAVIGPAPILGSWAHYLFSYDGSTLRCYLNGVLVSSAAVSGGTYSFNSIILGFRDFIGTNMDGKLDDFRIYSKSLSSDLIEALANGNDGYTLSTNLDVNGTYLLKSGTVNTSTYGLNLAGNLTNNGGTLTGSGTVTLDGTNQTIGGTANTTFWNLVKTVSSPDTLTIAAGRTITVGSGTTLQGTDENNRLSLRSSSNGTQWLINSSATYRRIQYVDVKDSNNTNASAITCDTGCVNSLNNTNWLFPVTGYAYAADGVTPLGSVTVAISVNGAAPLLSGDTTAQGAFIINLGETVFESGQILTLYLDGETQKAVTATVTDGVSISGFQLTQDHLIVRHESAGPITTANLATANTQSDEDISAIYAVSGNDLILASGKHLDVHTGDTFVPAGAVTLSGEGDIRSDGTITAPSAITADGIDVAGSFSASGAVTANDVTVSGILATETALNAQDIRVTGTGSVGGILTARDLTVQRRLTAGGAVSVRNLTATGTLALGANPVTVSGNLHTRNGTITGTSAFTLSGSGSHTVIASNSTIPSLALTGTGSFSMSGALAVSSTLTVSSGSVLDLSGSSLTVPSTFTNYGTVKLRGSETLSFTNDTAHGTLEYNGTGAHTGLAGKTTFRNLTLSGAGTWSLNAPVTINGRLLLASAGLNENAQAVSVAGSWTDSGGTFTGNGTVTFTGSGTIAENEPFDELVINSSAQSVTVTDPLAVSGSLLIRTGQLAVGSTDPTITVEENWENEGGSLSAGSGTVVFSGDEQSMSGSTLFWNLKKEVGSGATWAFGAGDTQSVNGTWTAKGAVGQTLYLASSDPGTSWKISPRAYDLQYINITDSENISGETILAAADAVNGGGNTDWAFPIAVTVKTKAGVLSEGGKTVAIAVNGGTVVESDTSGSSVATFNDGNEAHTVSGIESGALLAIWLSGETENGMLVTRTNGTSLSFTLYEDTITIQSEVGTAITNGDLNTASGAGLNADINALFTMSGSTELLGADDVTVRIETGDTYRPGADITAHDFDINGTFAMEENNVTVTGSWDATGGFFTGENTVRFTSQEAESITVASNSFNNVVFVVSEDPNAQVGNWTTTDGFSVNGSQWVQNGATNPHTVPTISNIEVTPYFDRLAVVNWETNIDATSKVWYGTDSGSLTLSSVANSGTVLDTGHAVTLSDLSPATTYYFYVESGDYWSNTASGAVATFTTLAKLSTAEEVEEAEAAAVAAGGGGSFIRRIYVESSSAAAGSGSTSSGVRTDCAAQGPLTLSDLTVTVENEDLSAIVSWNTNNDALSHVKFGLNSIDERMKFDVEYFVTTHAVRLEALRPSSTYRLKAASVDRCGSVAISDEVTFQTGIGVNAETLEELELHEAAGEASPQLVEKAMTVLRTLLASMPLFDMQNALEEQNQAMLELAKKLPGPILSGEPRVTVTDSAATISWNTNEEANSLVSFAAGKTGTDDLSDVYGDPEARTLDHAVTLVELKPGQSYHYTVKSKTPIGTETTSSVYSFTTLPESPEVKTYTVDVLDSSSATFKWQTNAEADGKVTLTPYKDGKLLTSESMSIHDKETGFAHAMIMEGIEGGVVYQAEIGGTTPEGRVLTKVIRSFSTSEENLAPQIAGVQTEASLSPGKDTRIQVIVSWKTSERATGLVRYQKGVATGSGGLTQSTPVDTSLATKHAVILAGLDPGTVYSFQVESADVDDRTSVSKTFTLLTPRSQESVFQVITKEFENAFGWMGGSK